MQRPYENATRTQTDQMAAIDVKENEKEDYKLENPYC